MRFKLDFNDHRRRQVVFLGLIVWLVLANGAQLLAASVDVQLTASPPISPVHIYRPSQLPGGGRALAGQYRFVALYGVTTSPVLGALGEQKLPTSVKRVKKISGAYQAYSKQKIMPTFEVIATVAAAGPTKERNYSQEASVRSLERIVDFAAKHHVYVVLDLQPGRDDFLRQAKRYQALLERSNVGLALDPEWRLGRHELPLEQIGSVSVDEINQVSAWLDQLVGKHNLPQKLLLIHQFRTSMIRKRTKLVVRPQLMTVIQMDGQGSQGAKRGSWQTVQVGVPKGVYFGWKNFYDEDKPTLSVKKTMALKPQPAYVSYQ